MVVTMLLDIESAYYRVPMMANSVGQQALKVTGRWMVALALVFGKRRSGEAYPLVSTAASMLHRFMVPPDDGANGSANFDSIVHVDDFAALEINADDRVYRSMEALIFAVKVLAGHDAPAANKIVKNID
jgi:hypothetical protein